MAILTDVAFLAKWATLFATNGTRNITGLNMRDFRQDISDSFFNKTDDAYTGPFPYATTTGTGTAYAATLNPSITAYANNQKFLIKANATSVGSVTLNFNSVGTKKWFITPGVQAVADDIQIGTYYLIVYDSALDTGAGGFLMIAGGGGSGTGIESVTGDVVDNTDPDNPVINIPTLSEIGTVELNSKKLLGRWSVINGPIQEVDCSSFIQLADDNSVVLTTLAGLSVFGKATTGAGEATEIVSSTNKQVLINRSGTLQFDVLASGDIPSLSASYITVGATAGGELAGTYPNPTLVNSAVIGKVITGVSITGGSISATDTILQAFGKLQNQINGVLGGSTYQGVWNATTNSPVLTSSTGTKGYYYVVSVAGSTNLDGTTDWKIGDWAIFNGTTWDKVDNTDAVSSVNGLIGAVALTGTTNRITVSGANVFDISASYVGQSSITTVGTLTGGATGAGFTIALGTSTITGVLPIANGGSMWTVTGSDIYYNTGNVMIGAAAAPAAKLHLVDTSTSTPRGIIHDQYSTGTNSSQHNMRKARGTFASPTTIVVADVISNLNSWGHDGTNFLNNAAIRVTSVGTIGTGRTPTKMEFFTMTDVTTGVLTLAMSISEAQVITLANALPVASGGTGIASYAIGDLIYASGTTTLSKLTDVAVGSVLISGGVTTAPSWTNNLGLGITSAATRFHIKFAGATTGNGIIWQDSANVQRFVMTENGSTVNTIDVSGAGATGVTNTITVTATANSQTQYGYDFNLITVDAGFTGLSRAIARLRLNTSATDSYTFGSTQFTSNAINIYDLRVAGDVTVRNATGAMFLKGGSGTTTGIKFGTVATSSTNANVAFNWTGTIHNLASGLTRTLTATLNDLAVTSVDGSTITYQFNNQTPSFTIGNSTMTLTGYNWNPTITGTGTITHYAMLIQSGLVGIGIATPTYQFQVQATLANQSIFSVAENGGTKIIEATEVSGATRLGFFAATPVIQPASANQAAITDSTGGTAGFTLVDVGAIFSQSNVNNNFASINRQLDSFRTALVNLGAIKGAA